MQARELERLDKSLEDFLAKLTAGLAKTANMSTPGGVPAKHWQLPMKMTPS